MTEEERAAEAEAKVWRALFLERVGHWSTHHGYENAQRLAWAELEARWHQAYGERVDPTLCAGCRRPLGSSEVVHLLDGNAVHDAAENDCLIRHGERWRKVAAGALEAMGLSGPEGARVG